MKWMLTVALALGAGWVGHHLTAPSAAPSVGPDKPPPVMAVGRDHAEPVPLLSMEEIKALPVGERMTHLILALPNASLAEVESLYASLALICPWRLRFPIKVARCRLRD